MYDDAYVNGSTTTSVIAAFNSNAATTITTATPIIVNQIQFTGANAFTTLAGVAANPITLSGTATTGVDVVSGGTGTITAVLAGSTGLTKTGAGTLTLGGVNTFTGGLTISAGTVSFGGPDTNLGAGGVTLDGGTLTYTGAAYTPNAARKITVGPNGGTFNLAANVKVTANTTGFFIGSGTLTRAGTVGNLANNLSISAANTTFSGGWVFTGGAGRTHLGGQSQPGFTSAYCFPRIRSMAQQPLTCGPLLRQ